MTFFRTIVFTLKEIGVLFMICSIHICFVCYALCLPHTAVDSLCFTTFSSAPKHWQPCCRYTEPTVLEGALRCLVHLPSTHRDQGTLVRDSARNDKELGKQSVSELLSVRADWAYSRPVTVRRQELSREVRGAAETTMCSMLLRTVGW